MVMMELASAGEPPAPAAPCMRLSALSGLPKLSAIFCLT